MENQTLLTEGKFHFSYTVLFFLLAQRETNSFLFSIFIILMCWQRRYFDLYSEGTHLSRSSFPTQLGLRRRKLTPSSLSCHISAFLWSSVIFKSRACLQLRHKRPRLCFSTGPGRRAQAASRKYRRKHEEQKMARVWDLNHPYLWGGLWSPPLTPRLLYIWYIPLIKLYWITFFNRARLPWSTKECFRTPL